MSATTANVQLLRIKVMELIFEIERQYTRLSLRENAGAAAEVPSAWQGKCFLSYILQGYVVDEVVNVTGIRDVLYI